MKPGSEILVSCADRIVWVRVEGNGSSTNSKALKDFAKEMIHRGAREFIVDLCNCPMMDSTFMGTLAGISLWLGELGEGCLSVVNLNERNAESLRSLGLDQLFSVRVSALFQYRWKKTAPLGRRRCWKLTRPLSRLRLKISRNSRTSFSTSRKSCICRNSLPPNRRSSFWLSLRTSTDTSCILDIVQALSKIYTDAMTGKAFPGKVWIQFFSLHFLRLTSPEMGPAVKLKARRGHQRREIVDNTRVFFRRSRGLFAKRRIRTVGGRGTNPFGSCAAMRLPSR